MGNRSKENSFGNGSKHDVVTGRDAAYANTHSYGYTKGAGHLMPIQEIGNPLSHCYELLPGEDKANPDVHHLAVSQQWFHVTDCRGVGMCEIRKP